MVFEDSGQRWDFAKDANETQDTNDAQARLISYVVPCYNAAATIRKCLESIIESHKNGDSSLPYEIIVVDNACTDETAQIVSEIQRIHHSTQIYLLNEDQRGRSYARNHGALKACGKWLAFIDADVWIEENWAERLISFLEEKGATGGCGPIIPTADFSPDHKEPLLLKLRTYAIKKATRGTFHLLGRSCFESPMINSAACIYDRKRFYEIKGFDPYLPRHEDIDLSKRFFLAGGDLGATEKSRAYVYFNGENFWDYLKRSFEEGKTKIIYFHKWEGLFDEPQSSSNGKGLKVKMTLALRDLYSSLIQLFKYPNQIHLFLLILFVVSHLGKVWGLIFCRYPSPILDNERKDFSSATSRTGMLYFDDRSIEWKSVLHHRELEDRGQVHQEFLW